MSRLAGKVALITGASSGLGRVGALRFAEEGAMVVIADVTDGDEAIDAIAAAGGEASFVRTDVTDDASVKNAIDFAVETYGGLHVLYNNAGVMLGDDDNPVTTSIETYQKTMDINVLGTLLGCKYAIPAMQATCQAERRRPAASSTSPRSSPTWAPPPRRSPTRHPRAPCWR